MESEGAAAPGRSWPAASRNALVLGGVAGLAAIALPLLHLPDQPTLALGDSFQFAAAVTCAIGCLAGARKLDGAARLGWRFIGLAASSWAAGKAAWTWYEVVRHVATPIPSLADVGFLLSIPLAIAGILLLSPVASARRLVAAALTLDGVLVALAVFVVAWPVALEHQFRQEPDVLRAILVVVYPLADLALLGMAAGVLLRGRDAWRSPLVLLYAGFGLIAVSDIGLALGVFDATYATGQVPDAGWVMGYLAIGAAARASSRAPPLAREEAVVAGRAIPFLAVGLGFVGFAIELVLDGTPDRAFRLAMAGLVVAALARQALLTREFMNVVRQREHAEAARREQAAVYESIVETASEGVFLTTLEGRILFSSHQAARMMGFADAAQMRTRMPSMSDLFQDPAARPAFMRRVMIGDFGPFETVLVRRDGSPLSTSLRARPVPGPDGTAHVITIVEDITARKLAEAAQRDLEQQQGEVRRLNELNRMRIDFLNTAAHDLKTPLTPLRLGMATLRRRGHLPAAQRTTLDLMDRNIVRFQLLVEDMLDAARLQSGRLMLRRERVDLRALVRDAVASFQEPARQGGVRLQVDALPAADLDADPLKAMQVLMNLVSNAVKYTPHGGRVDVRVAPRPGEAVLEARDSGLGFDPQQAAQLFQPFVRLHEAVPGVAKGTGLGLYISKGIVEQHGGRIWAESEGPGQGATFFVAWPLAGPGTPAAGSSPAGPSGHAAA